MGLVQHILVGPIWYHVTGQLEVPKDLFNQSHDFRSPLLVGRLNQNQPIRVTIETPSTVDSHNHRLTEPTHTG